MIIFLYGQDTYRSREKLKEIISHYQKVHPTGLNLKIHDDLDYQDFKDEFQQTAMFKEKKLIVLKNVFSNKEFKHEFLNDKKQFIDSQDIIIFFQEDKVLETDKLAKFLKEKGKVQRFDLLQGEELKDWVKEQFKQKGAIIDSLAINKLIEFVNNDLWQLNNEINKLVNYRRKGTIRIEDIESLVKPNIETEIFKTIDALAQKNKKKALDLIEKHLKKGDSPFYILSMIIYQFRNLILAKTKGLKGVHPFVIRKTNQLVKNYSLEELKKIYQWLFQIDLNIKTGKIDPEQGIRMLIASI